MTIKFMTSNIWADVFGNPVKGRDSALCRIISKYKPDVIALQEVHPNWHASTVLKQFFEENRYIMSAPELNGNPLNYTPVIYNAEKFEEISSSFLLYSGPNDYLSKSASASLLRFKADNKVSIAAVSTHLYCTKDETGRRTRMSSVAELNAFLNNICGDTIPAFCGGDYNCSNLSAPFHYMRSEGMYCASELAQEKYNFIRTHHKNPVFDKENNLYIPAKPSGGQNCRSIDHIVCRGSGFNILSYRVIADTDALILSDHCPVLIEIEL